MRKPGGHSVRRKRRVQLYLEYELHDRLTRLAKQQRRTLSALVRDAPVRVYGAGSVDEQLRTLKAIAGLWSDRDDLGDTEAYIRRLGSRAR